VPSSDPFRSDVLNSPGFDFGGDDFAVARLLA
jgi:hypothetical protein